MSDKPLLEEINNKLEFMYNLNIVSNNMFNKLQIKEIENIRKIIISALRKFRKMMRNAIIMNHCIKCNDFEESYKGICKNCWFKECFGEVNK